VEITEVRIKLMDDPQERLQAFCSITFDSCFVIRDLKIIEGAKGSFVAMPSRKLTDRCPQCNSKNHLRSLYCNQCGARLREDRAVKDDDGRAKLYADIAHPINCRCREMIQAQVLRAYDEEIIKSKQPGYICTYDDYGEENYATLDESFELPVQRATVINVNGSAHRIDAAEAPNAPHHAAVPGEVTRRTVEEGFGAGIL
jgi:stage V sporulation protein G